MSRNAPRLAIALAAVAAALPTSVASAAHVQAVQENYQVPTVGGAVINVDVVRPKDEKASGPVPVILTYSPYNSLRTTANTANDSVARAWVHRGYARAVADVIGTRNSTGCWDYGGAKETQSGVDVVKYLAAQDWSNGRVGMMGTSYDGTTANMVAATGVPELKAIVPIAAISRWYGYAYSTGGVRYTLNSESATDEGLDTPLAFDFGFGRTPHGNPDRDPAGAVGVARERLNPCDSVQHTEKGYDLQSPDYDGFWVERDYRRRADRFRAAVLIAHGWQDYNVKQEEGVSLFEQLPADDPKTAKAEGVPLKRLWMTQGRHSSPTGTDWNDMLWAFLDRYLRGEDTGIENTPVVRSQGRRVTDTGFEAGRITTASSWPPSSVDEKRLWIRRTFDQDIPGVTVPTPGTGETGVLSEKPNNTTADNRFTWVSGPTTEELTNRDPLNEPGHGYYSLYFKSAPLEQDTRMAGTPVLDGHFRAPAGATVTPVLLDVAPDGTLRTIARGFLNLDYRDGLEQAKPAPGEWVRARAEFLPQDVTLPEGHRIGLMVMGANTIWAAPGSPGAANILTGRLDGVSKQGSSLRLPIAPVGG